MLPSCFLVLLLVWFKHRSEMTNYSIWWFSPLYKNDWRVSLRACLCVLICCVFVCIFFSVYMLVWMYVFYSSCLPDQCCKAFNLHTFSEPPISLWFSSIMQSALATHLFSLHSTKTKQLPYSSVRKRVAWHFLSCKNNYFLFCWHDF